MSLNPEDYEDWDDSMYAGRKSGGGGGHEGPTQSQKDERKAEEERLRRKRQEDAEASLNKFVATRWENPEDESAKKEYARYLSWVGKSLRQGFPDYNESEVEFKTKLPGGPGGQHHQKNQTAVVLTHIPSLISAKEETRRSQTENHKAAQLTLMQRLEDHIKLWKQTSPEYRERALAVK